jgi:hypothetical protein
MGADAIDMPIFLTPYLLIEGSIAEVVDCLTDTPYVVGLDNGRTIRYRGAVTENNKFSTMYGTIAVHASYGIDESLEQHIGWLILQRIRTKCHVEMHAYPPHQQLACDVLLSLPSRLNYLAQVESTILQPWDLLKSMKHDKNPFANLPPITDSTNIKILQLYMADPELTDEQIGERLGLGRQPVNRRRNQMAAMGYPCSKSRDKNR